MGPLISILVNRLTNVRMFECHTVSVINDERLLHLFEYAAVIRLEVLENELTIYTTIMFATTSCIYVNKWLEAILMKYVLKHLSKSQNNNDDNIKCVQCSLAKLMFNTLTWSKYISENLSMRLHWHRRHIWSHAYGAGSCKHSHRNTHSHELEHIPNST